MKTTRVLLVCAFCANAAVYDVGPGKPRTTLAKVPWKTLAAGDIVNIHYKSTPYYEKFAVNSTGTAAAPIIIRGVPDSIGNRPILDGADAAAPRDVNYWNEERGLVKIGGAGWGPEIPSHITIEGLEIRNTNYSRKFYGVTGGYHSYSENAAGIYVERGTNITVRNCVLYANGHGLFVGSNWQYTARNILIERNLFHDNGWPDDTYRTNAYTHAANITYQYNRMIVRPGKESNNIKDRSSNGIYRYNWIEGGNRQLDLVDSTDPIREEHGYHKAWVYGNYLVEYPGYDNGNMVLYGGDHPDKARHHAGTLYFYNNTLVSARRDDTVMIMLSRSDALCDFRNNIMWNPLGRTTFLMAHRGTMEMRNKAL